MHDNGWDNVIEMSYYASDDMRSGSTTPLVSRLRGLINTLKGGGRWRPSVANCSVHIWMSPYDCIVKHGHEWKIDSNYEYTGLLEALSELSSTCGGGEFVSINTHPEDHQSTGNLMLTATKVIELRKNAGVIVTDNDLVWKQISGLTDRNYSISGESKLFYVLQKKLVAEMIMDVLSLDAQTVTDLEYACEGVSPLQFNTPQGATGGNVRYHYKPDFTARFNKQKMYRDEQRREGKAIGKEGNDDTRSKWYHFEDMRTQCRAEGAQSTTASLYNANTCINCHANGLIEQNTMHKGAERPNIIKRFFAECSLVLGDMNELESKFDGDMDAFVSHLIVKLFDSKMEQRRERQNSAYGATTETLYKLRGCVGSSVRSRHTEYSPLTTKRSWVMGWILRSHILLRR